jgi:exopolysaccharide production protein ExoZ
MISNLQVLRGLAALAVVFYHTALTFNGGLHTDFQAVAIKIVPRQLGCSALLCEFYAHDYIAFLILGVLSFYIWSGLKGVAEDWPRIAAAVAILSTLVFILWNAHPPFAGALQQRVGFPLYYAMPPLLVLSVLTLHSARFSCTWKVPLLLGDASYALYLTHIMVMELARIIRDKTIGDQVAAINPSESVLAMLGALVVCSLFAIAVHTKVELPTLRALRRLLIKRSDPPKLPVPRPA